MISPPSEFKYQQPRETEVQNLTAVVCGLTSMLQHVLHPTLGKHGGREKNTGLSVRARARGAKNYINVKQNPKQDTLRSCHTGVAPPTEFSILGFKQSTPCKNRTQGHWVSTSWTAVCLAWKNQQSSSKKCMIRPINTGAPHFRSVFYCFTWQPPVLPLPLPPPAEPWPIFLAPAVPDLRAGSGVSWCTSRKLTSGGVRHSADPEMNCHTARNLSRLAPSLALDRIHCQQFRSLFVVAYPRVCNHHSILSWQRINEGPEYAPLVRPSACGRGMRHYIRFTLFHGHNCCLSSRFIWSPFTSWATRTCAIDASLSSDSAA